MARKATAAAKAATATPAPNGEWHVTTIRLTGDEYRQLRKYIALHEARTGERLTHQSLFKSALFDRIKTAAKSSGGD